MEQQNKKFWNDKKVLITGGTGFIGTNLTNRLKSYNADVLSIGSKDCNLENQNEVTSYFKELDKFDYIFHLAAWTAPGTFCLYHSAEQYHKNTLMHVHLLDAWHRYQPQAKLIGIGASCSYPGHLNELKEEDYWKGEPHESLHAYAMTKRMLYAGQLAYKKQYGLNSIHVIFATLYGPGDYFDDVKSHVVSALIARFCNAVKNGLDEIVVWGDGYQTREFVCINDQIDSLLLAAEKYEGDLLNIGTGISHTIRELAETIAEFSGYNREIVYDTTKFVGIRHKVLNIDKAKRELNWRPKVSLRDGIQRTVNWYRENILNK